MKEIVVKFTGNSTFSVHLKPMTVRAILSLISSVPALFEPDEDDGESSLSQVLLEHKDVILKIIEPFVVRTDGKGIESLIDVIDSLHDPFMEVNPLFLPIMSAMIHQRLMVAQPDPESDERSTEAR